MMADRREECCEVQLRESCCTEHMALALRRALVCAQPGQQLLLLLQALEATLLVDATRRASGARAVLLVIGGFKRNLRETLVAAYDSSSAVRARIQSSQSPCCHLMMLVRSYGKDDRMLLEGSCNASCWQRIWCCFRASTEREEQVARLAHCLMHGEGLVDVGSHISDSSSGTSLSTLCCGHEESKATQASIKQLPLRHVSLEELSTVPEASRRCSICCQDFQVGDEQRTLPCFHLFHPHCIDPWLLRHARCPLCSMGLVEESNPVH